MDILSITKGILDSVESLSELSESEGNEAFRALIMK